MEHDIPMYVGVPIVLLLLTVTFCILALKILAPKDILFTLKAPLNESKFVTDFAGDPVKELTTRENSKTKGLLNWLGIAWIGFFRKIFEYELEREKLAKENITTDTPAPTQNQTNSAIVTVKEKLKTVFLKTQFTYEIPKIEISGNLKTRFVLRVFVEIEDPKKFLWGNLPHGTGSVRFLGGKITAKTKDYFALKSYEEITKAQMEKRDSEFSLAYSDMNAELLEKAGLKIIGIELIAFDEQEDPEIEAILRSKEIVEREKEIELENAKKDLEIQKEKNKTLLSIAETKKQATIIESEGEVSRIEKIYGKVSGLSGGKEMFIAEQIRDSGLLVNGGNGSVLINTPTQNPDPTQNNNRTNKKRRRNKK